MHHFKRRRSLFFVLFVVVFMCLPKDIHASAYIDRKKLEKEDPSVGSAQRRQLQINPSVDDGRYLHQSHRMNEKYQEVTLEQIWSELEVSCEIWPVIANRHPKKETIKRYKSYYRQKGIYINKSADYYVSMIDGMLKDHPDMVSYPFVDVLKLAAIMEYDFDNGMDKDQLALSVLGPQAYKDNKKRLGMQ